MNKRKAVARKNVRIPEPIIDQVDRIVKESGLYVSRQQFIEAALRDRIERTTSWMNADLAFSNSVKNDVLLHFLLNAVLKGELPPADHYDFEKIKNYAKLSVERLLKREGLTSSEEQVDSLADSLATFSWDLLQKLKVGASRKSLKTPT
jgi:hypothetical protein